MSVLRRITLLLIATCVIQLAAPVVTSTIEASLDLPACSVSFDCAHALTVGNSGTVDSEYNTNDFIWGTQPLTATGGDYLVSSCHVYQIGSTSGRVIVRVYNTATNNTIGTCSEIASSSAGGAYDSASGSFTITSGTSFRIALISNGAANIGLITTGGTGNRQAKDAGGIVYPTFDSDPVVFNYAEDDNIAVYLTYTLSGGGASGTPHYYRLMGNVLPFERRIPKQPAVRELMPFTERLAA